MKAIHPFTLVLAAALLQHHCGMGAARLDAQTTASKAFAGTVIDFKPASLEIRIQPDSGSARFIKVGPDTEVVQVPPGDRGLAKAKPVKVTDIVRGDRVLVSFVSGLTEARRIILITSDDIAARNEAVRQDWKTRGISGTVTAVNGDQIAIRHGLANLTITVTAQTRVSRYAPDSVKFTDALPSSTSEIAVGDQLQARGNREPGQTVVVAEDLVFGTFLTKLGTITAVNWESGEVVIQDSATQKALTVRITADSRVKKMPEMKVTTVTKPHGAEDAHTGPPAGGMPVDVQKVLEMLPAASIDDLKVGGGVVVTSTRGARPDQVTAIMVLANADFFVKASGEPDGLDAINRMHGGTLVGPNGFSLPTILQ